MLFESIQKIEMENTLSRKIKHTKVQIKQEIQELLVLLTYNYSRNLSQLSENFAT